MGSPNYIAPPTQQEYIDARAVALRLREVAEPGSEAGLVLHHLSNALGTDPMTNDWAVIVLRAMTQQARAILGES
jgi:hypothetical protein